MKNQDPPLFPGAQAKLDHSFTGACVFALFPPTISILGAIFWVIIATNKSNVKGQGVGGAGKQGPSKSYRGTGKIHTITSACV